MGQYTEKEYNDTIDNIVFRDKIDLGKIEKTIVALWNYMGIVGTIVIKDGKVIPLRWFNVVAYYRLAVASYEFIVKIVEIWKK